MFYCDPCKEVNGWPESMFKSYGPCEECGQTGCCHEVASTILQSWDVVRNELSTPDMLVAKGKAGRKTDAEREQRKLTEADVITGSSELF